MWERGSELNQRRTQRQRWSAGALWVIVLHRSSLLPNALGRPPAPARPTDHLPYQILKTERLTLTEGERERERERGARERSSSPAGPSKLRLRRLDGKSERARQIWAERTRKPRSALLRYVNAAAAAAAAAARRAGRQTIAIATAYREGGRARARTGMGKESGYFSAFVKSEKVSYGVEQPRSGRKGGAGGRRTVAGDSLTRYHTSPRNACTPHTMHAEAAV